MAILIWSFLVAAAQMCPAASQSSAVCLVQKKLSLKKQAAVQHDDDSEEDAALDEKLQQSRTYARIEAAELEAQRSVVENGACGSGGLTLGEAYVAFAKAGSPHASLPLPARLPRKRQLGVSTSDPANPELPKASSVVTST